MARGNNYDAIIFIAVATPLSENKVVVAPVLSVHAEPDGNVFYLPLCTCETYILK